MIDANRQLAELLGQGAPSPGLGPQGADLETIRSRLLQLRGSGMPPGMGGMPGVPTRQMGPGGPMMGAPQMPQGAPPMLPMPQGQPGTGPEWLKQGPPPGMSAPTMPQGMPQMPPMPQGGLSQLGGGMQKGPPPAGMTPPQMPQGMPPPPQMGMMGAKRRMGAP